MLELIFAFTVVIILICIGIAFFIILGAMSVIVFKVPFVPTPRSHHDAIFTLLDLKPNQKFYDLGCGEGQFIIEAANRGAQATGFEISVWAYLRCQWNLICSRSHARCFFKNFYTADLHDADAVYCFLIKKVMTRVEEKIMRELKSGAKIISYGFALPTVAPTKIIKLTHTSTLYYYVKP